MKRLKLPAYDPEAVIELFHLMGFSLWMVQSLELALSNYLVFAHKITPELAKDEIQRIFERTEKRTFGSLFNDLNDDNQFSDEIKNRLSNLVDERNWLVHRINAQNQGDMFSAYKSHMLLARVEKIGNEAAKLGKIINDKTNIIIFDREYLSEKELNNLTQQILDSWRK